MPNIIMKLNLKEIKKGLYTLNNETNSSKGCAIIVHPFYCKPKEELVDFMEQYKGSMIIMEEEKNFNNTIEYFINKNIYHNKFFVQTEENSSEPLISWDVFLERVNELRDNKRVDLAGNYLHEIDFTGVNLQCVGVTKQRLDFANIDLNLLMNLCNNLYTSPYGERMIG